MSEPKKVVAIAKLKVHTDGVSGFDLYFESGPYGHYPCENGAQFLDSMTSALKDAEDYGYHGILFHCK